MKKFLLAAALIIGIVAQISAAEAGYPVFLFKCNFCGKEVQTEGSAAFYQRYGSVHPADCGLKYGCPESSTGEHSWGCEEKWDSDVGRLSPAEKARRKAEEKRQAAENAERARRQQAENERKYKAEIGRRIELRQQASSYVTAATSAFNKKDYGAAIQIFRKSLSVDPYNPYAHYMLAKSLYRVKAPKDDEFYGLVLNEIKSAIELAETQNDLADYWDYMAKVLRKLASRNLFNSNNNTDYAGMALQCQARAQQLRQQR